VVQEFKEEAEVEEVEEAEEAREVEEVVHKDTITTESISNDYKRNLKKDLELVATYFRFIIRLIVKTIHSFPLHYTLD
jgi:hypothetical protein